MLLLAGAGRAFAAAKKAATCPPGRFVITAGSPLDADRALRAPGPDVLVIDPANMVALDGRCTAVKARIHVARETTQWSGRWRRSACTVAGVRQGSVRAKLVAPDCDALQGTLIARSGRRMAFRAVRSTCGDGAVDAGRGETCDGASGCDDASTCDPSACTCVARPTTTVTTTSTTTLPSTTTTTLAPGPSVARQWNEELLNAIRRDTPRPTVHARNLFHVSAAMYDAWAAYDATARPYIASERHVSADPEHDAGIAMSFAAYRVLRQRFATSPGAAVSLPAFDARMAALGLDPAVVTTDGDAPAAVGNRIGAAVIAYGLADGANEAADYADPSYVAVNAPLVVKQPGTIMVDPNRWQPLALDQIVTQNGIILPDKVQKFIGSAWGQVTPFALVRATPGDVYVDPLPPPYLGDPLFTERVVQVLRLSSQLDPDDGELIDISPGRIGNNLLGTNDGTGYALNPATGQPYAANVVKRGDFGRVLAEFWADGPKSETPPGHWNVIANAVSDRLTGPRRIAASGPELSRLEWDVKLYFALNGALHDAAIACWDAKRKYDYVRPISMIRYMGGLGQSSDTTLPSYDPAGLPLVPGLIELITADSTAPGQRHQDLVGQEGKIAVRAWPGQPVDPLTEVQGARWILAVNWVPYQKNTFVTPAFAAYTSGHSTYSRAAAELMTRFTGSAFFPGGLGEFVAPADTYLTFERGPTATVRLQWATYDDAADQAGQSRIWGGIHVGGDDFGGRRMGATIGPAAYALALQYFAGGPTP